MSDAAVATLPRRLGIPAGAARLLLPVAVFMLLLAIVQWWVAHGAAPMTIPRPTDVARLLWAEHAVLAHHTAITVLTAAWGFLLALTIALTVGAAAHVWPRLETPVLTIGAVLSSIPLIAIAPMLSVWLGLTISVRVLITALICAFPMLVSVIQGLRASKAAEQELFTVLAASPWQRFRLLALPGAMTLLFVGLRIAAPLAMLGALIGEWNGAEEGLGVLMLNAMFGLQVARLWATVAIACAVSSLGYLHLGIVERVAGYRREPSRAGA